MEQLTKCAAIYGYGLTVSGVAGFAGKGQDIFVCGAVKPGKDNILRVAYIQTVDFVFLLNITGAGAQIPDALGPVGLFRQLQGDIFKEDMLNIAGFIPVNQNPVLTGTVDVPEGNIFNITNRGVLFPAKPGNCHRFGFSPPVVGGKLPCINGKPGKGNIFNAALIPKLQGNSPVAAGNVTVLYQNIAERGFTLRTEFDGSTGGNQSAAGNGDIFTGTILHGVFRIFENNTVVSTFYVAADNPHVFTVVRVDSVTVCKTEVVDNPDTFD